MFERQRRYRCEHRRARIAALAQFLLQLFHLPFQAFDAIESVVKAGVFHRLQPGEDGRERATKFPLLCDQMVSCVCHRKLLAGATVCDLYSCDHPPSTGSSTPVVKVASNARKRTALATSSAFPKRFIGTASRICAMRWSAVALSGNVLPMIGVSVGPGDTALTRIPRGRSSAANTRAKDRSAALAPPYAARRGIPLTLAVEVVRTTAPPWLISGASFWTAKNGPLAFRLNISSKVASVVFSRGAKRLNPALTKSRSKVSNSAFTREARASMSVNERASLETATPPFPSSFCVESRPACDRPVTRTRAPPSTSIFAVASPMPLVPPMITTFLPSYRSMCILLATSGCFAEFELFSTIIDTMAAVKEFLNYLFQNTVGPRGRARSSAITC